MATCTTPTTLRQGFVFLEYGLLTGTVTHKVAVGLDYHYSPWDTGVLFPEADLWGDAVAAVLPNSWHVTGWGTQDADHNSIYAASFIVPKVGTHAAATGAVDSLSATVTLTGKGLSVSGGCSGQTRHVLFVGKSFEFVSGQKHIGAGTDTALDTLSLFLATNAILWADFWGQKAGVRGKYPIQQNAAAQRRLGQ